MLKHVDVFSGIGGFPLGFEWAGLSEPSMFCEIEPWCRQILRKHWPTVPITNDVKELANDPENLVPDCDIITGGYPCQPFSVAGRQKAHEDDRHLWPYLYKIIACKRPTYAVLENVYGHIGLGLDTVLFDLEAEGYSTRTFVVPACAVNAPHRRDRLWIIAKNVGNTKHNGSPTPTLRRSTDKTSNDISQGTHEASKSARTGGRENGGLVAYSNSKGLEGWKEARDSEGKGQNTHEQSARQGKSCSRTQWESEPNVGRVANGIPRRVDRIRGLGNAIVPQIAMQIGLTIKEMELCNTKV